MTLAEVLLKSGWTQAQIDALDTKAMSGLTEYVSGVEKSATEKEQAAKAAADKAEADRKAAEASAVAAKTQHRMRPNFRSAVSTSSGRTHTIPVSRLGKLEKAKLAQKAADAAAEAAYYKEQRKGYLDTLGIKPEDAPEFKAAPAPERRRPPTPGTPTFRRSQCGRQPRWRWNERQSPQHRIGNTSRFTAEHLYRSPRANSSSGPMN